MDSVGPGSRGDVKNFRDIEIRLGCGGGPNRISLIGFAHMKRGAIHIRIDRDDRDSHFMAGANDAHGNLATIRYEDLFEHKRRLCGSDLRLNRIL